MKTRQEIEQLAQEEYKDNLHNPFFTAAPMGYIKGYTQCQEDMADKIKKQISDFQHDLRECTSTYVKENCEGAIFGLNRLLNSLNKQD